jgi:hypothetical protein
LTSAIDSVPNVAATKKVPSRKPASPTRFTMKALRPASALPRTRYQKPISR